MTNQHSITPPPELVQQWDVEGRHQDYCTVASHIAARAAQWGADQELEACCELLTDEWGNGHGDRLRRFRRPKPPSLKEQGLDALASLQRLTTDPNIIEPLRRALEALPE